jgi:multiple sugar transport system permease protein
MTSRHRAPYLLLAPSLIYLLVFFGYPMVSGFGLSVTKEDGGLTGEHFRAMFSDFNFGPALRTTIILILVLLPVQFVIAMAMAMVVNARIPGSGALLYIYAIPLAISEIAAGLVWVSMLTENGYLNSLLQHVGLLDQPYYFTAAQNGKAVLISVIVAEVWRATSIMMVTLVSGLQSIPHEYTEACEVFGAGPVKRLFKVTLPLLKPSIQVALIIRAVLALQAFAVVSVVGGSGVRSLAGEAYTQYVNTNPRVASAYAVLILVLALFTVSVIIGLFRVTPEGNQ